MTALDWKWLAGFYDGEAFFDAVVREYEHYGYILRKLYTVVEVGQKERTVLEDIEDFIRKETGFRGSIYPRDDFHILAYTRVEACYEITKRLMPHLRHPTRIREAKKLLWVTQKYAEMKAPIERERGRIKIAEMWERIAKDYF